MTIAASVVVKPSRLRNAILTALCVGVAGIGIAIGCGLVGELSLLVRLVCSVLVVVIAIWGFLNAGKNQIPYRLDIGGTGQIRLTCLLSSSDRVKHTNYHPHSPGMLVTLLPDSTLWPYFMMLRLRDEGDVVHALSIWQDSLSPTSFRALAVACRWIAAHRFVE